MNHALTAHALPFSNTENNVLANANESPCASCRGMIYHVPHQQKTLLFAVKISYKAFVYFATRKKFSQISQAF